MVRKTKEEAQATRSALLDAAELLFHARGVSRTSLNDIAQAAGMTRGAIYWHFADKADLFNAMMMRVTLPLEETVQSVGDPLNEDPIATIRRILIHALRVTVTDERARRVFEIATHKVEYVDELLAVRDRHLKVRDDCLVHIENGLKLAAKRGQIRLSVPARVAAIGLHALVDGLIQNWILDPGGFDLLKVGRQALDAYLNGLEASGP